MQAYSNKKQQHFASAVTTIVTANFKETWSSFSRTGDHDEDGAVAGKNGCLNQESPDKGTGEMSVPDADFFNFSDHSVNQETQER